MANNLRIVHLAKYLPSYAGGMEAVTHEFAQAAVAMGVEVAIVGVDPGAQHVAGYHLEKEGIELIPVPSYGSFGPVPLAPDFFRLAGYLRSTDIVHVHLPNPIAELALLKHLMMTPKAAWPRLIPIAHVAIVRWPFLGKLWAQAVQKPLLERCEGYIAASEQLVEAVPLFQAFADKAIIMPFPTAAAVSKTAPAQTGPAQLLAVGRLVPYKGFDLLIDALASVAEPWELTIVGEGPQREALQARAQASGQGYRIRFVGRVSEAEKQQLLQSCDLLVAPSRTAAEAYGIVIAEAFAHGKAVVTSALPTGVAYLARGGACGAVFTTGSVEALREALRPLLNDRSLRQRCGNDNLRFWQRELTRARFLERYQNTINPDASIALQRAAG